MALKKNGDKKPVHVELESDEYDVLKKRAKLQERSVTGLARYILRDYVNTYRGDFKNE